MIPECQRFKRMSKPAIRIEEVSKVYRLGEVGTGMLSHDLKRWWAVKNGKADPFKKIGADKSDNDKQYSWALQNVSFDINQGDTLGIIGRNGAGKSTLLKILSKVTSPTSGSIKVRGRIASLLEVGTGFHPELTGRENIYLNGAILGMTKREITSKFDEIVDFSGVEKYIDTPVKRYSSGMYVRLAFSVAAHLDSEVLIVDEVLAVGDLDFQAKCLGKMGTIAKKQSRTVIFVSHDLTAVQKLCNRAILLQGGVKMAEGDVERVVAEYIANNKRSKASVYSIARPEGLEMGNGFIHRVVIEDVNNKPLSEIPLGIPFQVKVDFDVIKPTEHFIAALGFQTMLGLSLRTIYSQPVSILPGSYTACFKLDDILFSSGDYRVVVGLSSYERAFHYSDNEVVISIEESGEALLDNTYVRTKGVGFILNKGNIEIVRNEPHVGSI